MILIGPPDSFFDWIAYASNAILILLGLFSILRYTKAAVAKKRGTLVGLDAHELPNTAIEAKWGVVFIIVGVSSTIAYPCAWFIACIGFALLAFVVNATRKRLYSKV